jgi:hypothetical protein
MFCCGGWERYCCDKKLCLGTLGLNEHPFYKSLLVNVRERIATFVVEQVIIAGGKFHADETVWALIMHGD